MSKAVRLIVVFATLTTLTSAQSIRVWVTAVRILESKQLSVAEKRRIEAQLLTRLRDQTKSPLDAKRLEQALQECNERALDAFRQRGYLKAVLSRNSFERLNGAGVRLVRVTYTVEEGSKYSAGGMQFTKSSILNEIELHNLFPLRPGDTFNVEKVRLGLEKLGEAYRKRGYINFSPVPEVTTDDVRKEVFLRINLDEGKQYRIGRISVFGFSPKTEACIRAILKAGEMYSSVEVERVSECLPQMRLNTLVQRNDADATIDITIEHPDSQGAGGPHNRGQH